MGDGKPPRKAKSTWTKPTQFRLGDDTLGHLDAICAYLSELVGSPQTRADAVRYAAREVAKSLPPKGKKK